MTDAAKAAEKPSQEKPQGQNPGDLAFDEDLFEEFENPDAAVTPENENVDLWEADWDDEAAEGDDWQAKLRAELDKSMKE
eukprot:CAMPEP_0202859984 /NCGR_PEP_ID=MMETSP1391-20130828/1882_1 /ASSEMBLY_ACC=CAM_ASM_000867 /TAXON_ID=1034604 /ORGANISM="Chlamydomonas leiostraca, Strain SAG 11-49" /LENGTH=79 /DNA_ID=CAMNT_0049539103 /DNA_START=11 /DNA_END=250 /DNA_ORIENTATION=+